MTEEARKAFTRAAPVVSYARARCYIVPPSRTPKIPTP
ncbi:MAG: hypothetical protein AVDCRST_MAG89-1448 [uncultured Gemmatimonadetes bacterium]|uniref:Uncharacterized protein n=1 Tax=uncultured Gemmatimonadota bacterium TaxID=203437 RepID=A0A6J4KVR4_9BACT|nr:MAG: hypothetical protein AVDCRST_MAG89-1448 [uncultured Gemmatimonadota bacterium]